MIELFLALAWYQTTVMVIVPLVFLFLVFHEETSLSLLFLIITLSSIQYFGFIDFRTFDIMNAIYFVIGYLIIGCIWSLFKYKQRAEEIAEPYKRYKDHSKEDIIKEIKSRISNYQISFWIVFFPISIIKFALSDFVYYLISKPGRVYDYIARSVVEKMFK